MYSSGVRTSTAMIGSRMTGWAFGAASLKHMEPAILKAISEESTSWVWPSVTVALTPTTGKPARTPDSMASCTPASIEGMNSLVMWPPVTSLWNS